ncbi:Imm49 family immunity protein [Streptomyces sp. NPDC002835]
MATYEWQSTADEFLGHLGALSVETPGLDATIDLNVLALACHARRRGWDIRVEFPYLPQRLLDAAAPVWTSAGPAGRRPRAEPAPASQALLVRRTCGVRRARGRGGAEDPGVAGVQPVRDACPGFRGGVSRAGRAERRASRSGAG